MMGADDPITSSRHHIISLSVVVLDRPPALLRSAGDLLRPVPVRVPIREDVGRAAVVAEGALVIHVLAGKLRVRGDAADVTWLVRLVIDGVPAVVAFFVADTADGVLS